MNDINYAGQQRVNVDVRANQPRRIGIPVASLGNRYVD